MVENTEYYKILNISPRATQDDIRKAYHKSALKHHPDKGGDPDIFKKISLAYSILSNPESRNDYDQKGTSTSFNDYDPFTIFKKFFNQYDPLFVSKQPSQETFFIKVSLADLFKGKTVTMNIKTCICCPCCEHVTCKCCIGVGCIHCNNSGKVFDNCKICDNRTVIDREKNIKIYIAPGTSDKQKYVYKGEGNYCPISGQGDLVFIVKLIPHPRLKHQQNHLLLVHNITLYEALTGVSFKYVHLDQLTYKLKAENLVVSPDTTLQVNNFGMSELNSNYFGNLYIKFNIIFPHSLNLDHSNINLLNKLLNDHNNKDDNESFDDEFIVNMRIMDDTPDEDGTNTCKQQ